MEVIHTEWRYMKFFVVNTFRHKSYSDLWQILLTKNPYKTDFSNILHLVRIILTLPISSTECERAFSAQKRIKSDILSCMSVQRLTDLILIFSEGPDLAEFNPEKFIHKWMANGRRRIAGGPGQYDWPANIVSVELPPSGWGNCPKQTFRTMNNSQRKMHRNQRDFYIFHFRIEPLLKYFQQFSHLFVHIICNLSPDFLYIPNPVCFVNKCKLILILVLSHPSQTVLLCFYACYPSRLETRY